MAIRNFLDQLDESAVADTAADARVSDRCQYRALPITVDVAQMGADWVRYEVPPRNLSRGGVAFLLGHYVYSGTVCRVHLRDHQNQEHVIEGVVVRCRYLESSGTLHEVGVQFSEQIETEAFSRIVTPAVIPDGG